MNKAAHCPHTFNTLFLLTFIFIFLLGCSTTPQRHFAPAQLQAIRLNERGIAAELRGNYTEAEVSFDAAYRLQGSIENFSGMAVTLVNKARLNRLQGKIAEAEQSIDTSISLLPHVPDMTAEISFEKAKLLLVGKKFKEAAAWSERARAAADGASRGRMTNLLAEIRFEEGDTASARSHASEALRLCRDSGDQREEANALRLLGRLSLVDRQWLEAGQHLNDALTIDKELGISNKITADLQLLGMVSEGMGRRDKALAYLQRAADTSYSDGDRRTASSIFAKLADLYEQSGDKGKASEARQRSKDILTITSP